MAQARKKSVTLPAIVDLDALDHIRDELIDAVEHGAVAVKAAGVERVATNALFMLLVPPKPRGATISHSR